MNRALNSSLHAITARRMRKIHTGGRVVGAELVVEGYSEREKGMRTEGRQRQTHLRRTFNEM